jgi:hypothetical protein
VLSDPLIERHRHLLLHPLPRGAEELEGEMLPTIKVASDKEGVKTIALPGPAYDDGCVVPLAVLCCRTCCCSRHRRRPRVSVRMVAGTVDSAPLHDNLFLDYFPLPNTKSSAGTPRSPTSVVVVYSPRSPSGAAAAAGKAPSPSSRRATGASAVSPPPSLASPSKPPAQQPVAAAALRKSPSTHLSSPTNNASKGQ